MPIKTGLVGYGYAGATFHAPLLMDSDSFELIKVVSIDAETVLEEFPEVQVVSNIRDVLKDSELELIIITSPAHLQFEHTKKALLAGKHVVVEMPFTGSPEEAKKLVELADEHDLVLSAFHRQRWDGGFLTAKKIIQDGVLGKISTYKAHYNDSYPTWREEDEQEQEEILYTEGYSLIDQMIFLFGLPKFVTAEVFTQQKGVEKEDYFHITLGYNRLRVMLEASAVTLHPGPRIEVHGSKGSFLKYGMDQQDIQLEAGIVPSDQGYGTDNPNYYGTLVTMEDGRKEKQKLITLKGSYESYYKTLYKTIRENYLSPVPALDALAVTEIIKAAKTSSSEKKTVFFD